MKKIFNKKNPLFTFILSILLFAGTMLIGATDVNASTNDAVSLYYNDVNCVYHGSYENNIYIKVANWDYEKNVYVYCNSYANPNTWTTEKAEFFTSLDDNYDIFKVSIPSYNVYQYYITYTVNGETYTDNNDGNFYSRQTRLGSAKVLALRGYYGDPSAYSINALVKDSGDLKVVYTTDKWATVKEQSLSYYNTDSVGNIIYSTTLNLGDSDDVYDDFEYAISYTRDGITYWDNNFGENFDASYNNQY